MTDTKTISKKMSYWLRHNPAAGQLTLDGAGWAGTADVLAALGRARLPNGLDDLAHVVATNDKKRFELSPDGTRIRARQGHSIEIDAEWPQTPPPAVLYHGTVDRFLPSILEQGLVPGARHHVHLSPDVVTAQKVGARRGEPVILEVLAGALADSGAVFLLSSNGVWLTAHVPPAFLRRLAE
ncbi:RNA 2'-phosphotransferase [Flavisphingomonas formosensis]|uniref:RNA 2'-phosphotransferase n=1 Tax=Flavisphingomonas formosensis TaxID=861534 RepID=UPI0012F77AC5|nr:RNA 2'-phosphotransferase [Sphingomonas formosensis]